MAAVIVLVGPAPTETMRNEGARWLAGRDDRQAFASLLRSMKEEKWSFLFAEAVERLYRKTGVKSVSFGRTTPRLSSAVLEELVRELNARGLELLRWTDTGFVKVTP